MTNSATCPVIDDKGTVHHMFVVGRVTCLCGAKISSDMPRRIPSNPPYKDGDVGGGHAGLDAVDGDDL